MFMTPYKLIVLRLYNVLLGRYSLFSKILRKFLLHVLVYEKREKYVASSKYFEWKDIQ